MGEVDDSRGTFNTNSHIKFETLILRSRLCEYSYVHVLASGIIRVPNTWTAANANNRKNKIIKKCVSFTYCITVLNSTKINNAKYIDIIIPM